jgi:hypothetical protein
MRMRIDREAFLVAVASIAAACGAQPPPATQTITLPATSASSAASDPPKPIAAAQPIASAAARPAPATEGYVAPVGEGLAPASEGVPSQTSDIDADGVCRAKQSKRPASCDDDHGAPGDCKKALCRSTPFICEHCEDYKRYFKPRIAERAVACIVAQTRRQADDGCRTYQCGDEALKGACMDASADQACVAIARSCKTSLDECRGMLSGMNGAGRAKVGACAAKGCPYGLWSCIEGI